MNEIRTECKKRNLTFDDSDKKDALVALLKKDDNKPLDWGMIFSRILYHTGMSYEEISRRTIPQIDAILDGANENISIKMGIPSLFGSASPEATLQNTSEPPKVSQFAAMANMFKGM